MNSETILLIVGAVLIVTGVIGGGIEVKELKIPQVKVPTRVLAIVVGIVFLGMGLESKFENESASNISTPGPTIGASEPQRLGNETEWLHSQLRNAVYKASEAEIRANRENNPVLLRDAMAGEALLRGTQEIEIARREGYVQDSQLIRQEGWEFDLSPDQQTADVRLTETWRTRIRDAAGRCVGEISNHAVPQTISLRRTGAVWTVVNIMTMGDVPPPQPCSVP